MGNFLENKRILVTGACGSIGTELVLQLGRTEGIGELVCIDNNESELFLLEQRFRGLGWARFSLADIRDGQKVSRIMRGVDVVFHTAAFKHVILCERSPFEAVQTNILGVQNVIEAASECHVDKVIFTSSDKAVNPTSVMGTSKLMGERLMTAANSKSRGDGPIFCSTRFGNVLGSRGSVIPVFHEQIKKGGPVTVTEKKMTRFIMSIEEAVRLVIDSASLAKGGEVFVTKMPVMRIVDLAEVMIHELASGYGYRTEDVETHYVGAKPGEKMYEELMSDEEVRRSIELKRYFVVKPAFTVLYRDIHYDYPDCISGNVVNPYNSANEKALDQRELLEFLTRNRLLDDPERVEWRPRERYWPNG